MTTDVSKMSTADLRKEFADGLRLNAERLQRMAAVLVELEKRGERIDGPASLLTMLRRIAAGELLAEVVTRFAGAPKTASRLGKCPVAQQRRLLNDEKALAAFMQNQQATSHATRFGKGKRRPSDDDEEEESNDTDKKLKESPLKSAAHATVKDLAALIADMIQAHPHPDQVWAQLCRESAVKRLAVG
jgi:hypothetical protein